MMFMFITPTIVWILKRKQLKGLIRWVVLLVFFFFKQKTAYEMLRSLVGSEMV